MHYSEDSIVESRGVNTINIEISNISIDDQLNVKVRKTSRISLNTNCKSPSSENTKNYENKKQFSGPQARKQNINETAETNKEFH